MPNPFALFSQPPADGILKLDLGAGIRSITEFIFQALKTNRVPLPVWQETRHKETG